MFPWKRARASPRYDSRESGAFPAPGTLPLDLSQYPKLTREQAGHLRHFHNLASQLDGEWALMGSQEPAQEWLDAYRYQIATMAYAAGAAHFHRLPAMRSVFKLLMQRLIRKMLRRETWGYWYLVSQSGTRMNPSLKELRKPWADPVCKENVMYSGHLLLMVSLYAMLFDDDAFEQEGSMIFEWNPVFWGLGPERFLYSTSSLQSAIIREMEANRWLGACCEPNAVFIVCNQFPLVAMRYNDVRHGTNVLDEVLTKYKKSWADKGMVNDNGLFAEMYLVKQDLISRGIDISFTAWACAFMPWNYRQVQDIYGPLLVGFLTKIHDRINLNPRSLATAVRDLVTKRRDLSSSEVIAETRRKISQSSSQNLPYRTPTFGYVLQFVSEIGDLDVLTGLLQHADTFLKPSWLNGGLYYPRNDTSYDEEGNFTYMEPFTGNASIGYARLNVPGGQRKMWDQPWTKEQLQYRPWVDGVALDHGVDVLRGFWDDEKHALVITFQSWNGRPSSIRPVIRNLEPGNYGVFLGRDLVAEESVKSRAETIEIVVVVEHEVDVVVLRV